MKPQQCSCKILYTLRSVYFISVRFLKLRDYAASPPSLPPPKFLLSVVYEGTTQRKVMCQISFVIVSDT